MRVTLDPEGTVHFTNYDVSDGLENSDIRTITLDGEGNLWLGTRSGVTHTLYDSNGSLSFLNYMEADGLPSNHVQDSILFGNGGVLLGTDTGLILFHE